MAQERIIYNTQGTCSKQIIVDVEDEIIKNAEFISIEKEESFISEEEFFNIIDAKNQRLTSKSKRYQRSLYSHYMRAKREKDNGYRNDVLKKAEILRNNIETVLYLMQNEDFMTEWKNQVGEISPLEELKENGRMRRINIVRSYIE